MSKVVLITAYDDHGRLLLGKRKDNSKWTLSAGHIEEGETPEQAAHRELFEETGLKAKSLTFLKTHKLDDGTELYCYSAHVQGAPHSENDPDDECEEWKFVDVSEGLPANIYDNLHGPKDKEDNLVQMLFDLKKAEDLEKGSRQSALKFNPAELDPNDEAAIATWQGPNREAESRDMVPYMSGPERTRALMRLTGMTQTRRDSNGNIQFLLHRGVGPEERAAVVKGNKVSYTDSGEPVGDYIGGFSMSSWTPRYNAAWGFAIDYAGAGPRAYKHVISAWVPESAIHSIPRQYGNMSEEPWRREEDENGNPALKPGGENGYAHEWEVITGPHESDLASEEEVQRSRGEARKTPDDMINKRGLNYLNQPAPVVTTAQEQYQMGILKRAEEPTPTSSPKPQKVKVDKNLVVQHNLTAGNLQHAHQFLRGNLVAPSLAISHKDHPLTGFGEITLVGDPELVNPWHTPVYDADIYSPRHPETRYKVNSKEANKIHQWLLPYARKLKNSSSMYFDVDELARQGHGWINNTGRDLGYAAKLAYLEEQKGLKIKPPMKDLQLEHPIATQPAIQGFLRGMTKPRWQWEYDGPEHKALGDAVTQAIDQYVTSKNPQEDPEIKNVLRDAFKEKYLNENGSLSYGYTHKLIEEANKVAGGVPKVTDTYKYQDIIDKAIKPHQKDFEDWAQAKGAPAIGEQYIITNGGKKIAYTPENVLAQMTKKIKGGEGYNYGLGSTRAVGARKFKNLEEIKQHAMGRILPSEQFQPIKDAMDDRFTKLADKTSAYHPAHGFGHLDALSEAITESYKPYRSLYSELQRSGFQNIPPHVVQEISEFAKDLKNMPSEYFEAKPQRMVGLKEFKAAVVPDDVSQDVLDILNQHGITRVEKYKRKGPKSDIARAKAIHRAAKQHDLLLSEMDFNDHVTKSEVQEVDEGEWLAKHGTEPEDEVERLLKHPSVEERLLALKMGTVKAHHIERALHDSSPEVILCAMKHPLYHKEMLHRRLRQPVDHTVINTLLDSLPEDEAAEFCHNDLPHVVIKGEGLEKGSLQARLPFNPLSIKPAHKRMIDRWQTSGFSRKMIPEMEGNERTRALIKLGTTTQVRRGGNGEREFLLHRGVSPGELLEMSKKYNLGTKKIDADSYGSWTPDRKIAQGFANAYSGKVVSAWIPESFIHTIPNQYGQVATGYLKSKGKNALDFEKEVITTPFSNIDTYEEPMYQQSVDEIVNSSTPAVKRYILKRSEESLEKKTDPDEFWPIKEADKNGKDFGIDIDHKAQMADLPEPVKESAKLYKESILDPAEVIPKVDYKYMGLQLSSGVSSKLLYRTSNGDRFLIKPYRESRSGISGWAEIANQALYHVAGIGDNHQRVHVVEHDIGHGVKRPTLVIHVAMGYRPISEVVPDQHKDTLRKINVLDFLTGNNDRHWGNLLTKGGNPLAIDHSFSFQYDYPHMNSLRAYHQAGPMSGGLGGDPGKGSYSSVLPWWKEVSPKVRKEFEKQLSYIKDSIYQAHVRRNFNVRADWLDRAASVLDYNDLGDDWTDQEIPVYGERVLTPEEEQQAAKDHQATELRKALDEYYELKKAIAQEHVPNGQKHHQADHRGLLTSHPAAVQSGVDEFKNEIRNNPEVLKPHLTNINKDPFAGKEIDGVLPKSVFKTQSGNQYMLKPIANYDMQLSGWNESLSQALYHAGGIGHLHQRMHTDTIPHANGETPVTVVHMEKDFSPLFDHLKKDGASEFSTSDIKDWSRKYIDPKLQEDISKIHLMDHLTNNNDRHGANIMLSNDRKRVIAIDNGLMFGSDYGDWGPFSHERNKARAMSQNIKRGAGSEFSEHALKWWGQNRDAIKAEFNKHIGLITDDGARNKVHQRFNFQANELDSHLANMNNGVQSPQVAQSQVDPIGGTDASPYARTERSVNDSSNSSYL